ncbi:MAG: hypothetical protein JO222_01255, partial [Frankiales bacterium]|nr:hypothetical protein [Frankiales bacterium]
GDHVDKLGRSLGSAVKAYNGTVGSFEKQVLVTARKLNALEVVDGDLDQPLAVEESVRPLAAPELVESIERTVVALPAEALGWPATEAADAGDVVQRAEDYGLAVNTTPKQDRATG